MVPPASRAVLLSTILFLAGFALRPAFAASFPPLRSTAGMVAGDAELASQSGAEILRAGGNAADAAVASAFALGVVNPFASGIGGGGFALYYDHETPAVTVLDFREMAPAAAHRDLFVRDGEVDSNLSLYTGLAVGVPGEVAGLYELHRRFGTLPWADVVAPAIRLAEEGFPVGWLLAARLQSEAADLAERPALQRLFVDESGAFLEEGEILRRPDLAATLRAIAEQGPPAFYTGPTAQAIVDAAAASQGVMTLADLEAYRVVERPPLVGEYRGYTLYTMPPPSSGGTTILAALEVLEAFDLAAMGHNSSQYLHTLAEALQFAFADRATYLGDPDFVRVPADALIDPALGASRAAMLDPARTLPSDAYGLTLPPPDDGGTSHLSVVDASGNVVALTSTINTTFASMIVAGDTGIILNNEMDDFTAQPGVPNFFGLMGSEANAVAPGKRPLSSMSPTIVLRDGSPVLTLGGSGGPMIISATLQVFLNVVDFGMDVRAAVEAPRIHHQWMPRLLLVEPGIPVDVRVNLDARGHTTTDSPLGSAVQVIGIDAAWLSGASDPRKNGEPAAP